MAIWREFAAPAALRLQFERPRRAGGSEEAVGDHIVSRLSDGFDTSLTADAL